jgi:hypothetical protein
MSIQPLTPPHHILLAHTWSPLLFYNSLQTIAIPHASTCFAKFSIVMGRPPKDLNPHREWLTTRYHNGSSFEALIEKLRSRYGIEVSRCTLHNRFQQWGIAPKQQRTRLTPELLECLRTAFFETGMNDIDLKRAAEKAGHSVTLSGVVKARLGLGIYRRHTPTQLEARMELLREWFSTERSHENIVRQIGADNLQVHLRQREFFMPRVPLFEIYREFHADAIRQRRDLLHRRRGGWTTPGPNFMWCIDAYCKLADYGFEVYAAIDAHSRFITWFYCGYTTRCARSVLAQYLYIVGKWNFVPLMMRSDRGGETTLCAMAHWFLSYKTPERLQPRDLQPREPGSRQMIFNPPTFSNDPGQLPTISIGPLRFRDVWSFGKSTANQRIESWWRQLCDGRALVWRVSWTRSHVFLYVPTCANITRNISNSCQMNGIGPRIISLIGLHYYGCICQLFVLSSPSLFTFGMATAFANNLTDLMLFREYLGSYLICPILRSMSIVVSHWIKNDGSIL